MFGRLKSSRYFQVAVSAIAVGAAGMLFWLANPPRMTEAQLAMRLPAGFVGDPQIGETLSHIGGCADCHRSSSNDGAMIGGDPLITFAGTFFPPNITPDVRTGIGGWTDVDFVNAMVSGVSPDGRHYFPSFPYTSYARAELTDLLHLKAYLDGLEPVSSRPQDHELSFPFSFRLGIGLWKLAFHDDSEFEFDASKSTSWNRGAYIVNGLGHCGSCHTPRNPFFAERADRAFAGGEALKRGEKAAPRLAGLDAQKILNGLDEWAGSVSETSSMFLVTQAFSAHVPFEDHEAVAEYLSSLEN